MTDEPQEAARVRLAGQLPFLRGSLSPSFRRRRVTLPPGGSHPFDVAEWRGALVVVEHGRLHLECHDGGFRRFDEGAVLCLDGLALRPAQPGPRPHRPGRRPPGRA